MKCLLAKFALPYIGVLTLVCLHWTRLSRFLDRLIVMSEDLDPGEEALAE